MSGLPEAHLDLRKPLASVRFDTREATSASYERSDFVLSRRLE